MNEELPIKISGDYAKLGGCFTVYGTPESFGWLRRKQFERPHTIVYEKPNGELQEFSTDKKIFVSRQLDIPKT